MKLFCSNDASALSTQSVTEKHEQKFPVRKDYHCLVLPSSSMQTLSVRSCDINVIIIAWILMHDILKIMSPFIVRLGRVSLLLVACLEQAVGTGQNHSRWTHCIEYWLFWFSTSCVILQWVFLLSGACDADRQWFPKKDTKSFLSSYFLEETVRMPKAKEAVLAMGTLQSRVCVVFHTLPSNFKDLQVIIFNSYVSIF